MFVKLVLLVTFWCIFLQLFQWQDRGYNFQKQRHEDNYGHGSFSHVNHYDGSRGAAAPRSRGSRGRGGSGYRRFY
jgi:hypothetical protein